MSELLTLEKSSPQFESYLLGTFSRQQRALPVQTLNANSKSESVTFKIVPRREIQKPGVASFLFQTFKVKNFILVLFPVFLVLIQNLLRHRLTDPLDALISTIGILCAFVSLSFRNDLSDHLRGIDRVLADRGSRALQKGWITGQEVQKFAFFFLALALLCAIPVVLAFPSIAAVLILSVLTGAWAYFRGGEIPLFLMLGPLLTTGYQMALGGPVDGEVVALGCLWGWLVLYLRHLKNFAQIIPSAQAGFRNSVNALGFDGARRLLAFWWMSFLFFQLAYHFFFRDIGWGLGIFVALNFLSFSFIRRLKRLSTPAGSELPQVYRQGRWLMIVAITLWTLETLWAFFL